METLEQKPKLTQFEGFKISREDKMRIDKVVKENNWKRSAFLRVAVLRELDRLDNEKR